MALGSVGFISIDLGILNVTINFQVILYQEKQGTIPRTHRNPESHPKNPLVLQRIPPQPPMEQLLIFRINQNEGKLIRTHLGLIWKMIIITALKNCNLLTIKI